LLVSFVMMIDRRRERSVHTRAALLDSLLDWLRLGAPSPTATEIASKAGISQRSVFRNYPRLEELYADLLEREYHRILTTEKVINPALPLRERARKFVRQRSRRHEHIAPVLRGAHRFSASCTRVSQLAKHFRDLERNEVVELFARELRVLPGPRREETIALMSSCLSWSHWQELRTHQRVPVRAALDGCEHLVVRLLEQPPPESAE